MSIEVHVLKHMPDLVRREPRNVGVILVDRATSQVASRFVGETAPGEVAAKGAPQGVPVSVYQDWVRYFLTSAAEGRLGEAAVPRKRPSNFFLEPVATILDGEALAPALDRMFSTLVPTRPHAAPEPAAETLRERVEHVLAAARVIPERDPAVLVPVRDADVPLHFDYGYANGQYHLMDVLNVAGKPRTASRAAFDFAMRAELAARAGVAASFIAFADLSGVGADAEKSLRVVEERAQVIDVAQPTAEADLRAIVGRSPGSGRSWRPGR